MKHRNKIKHGTSTSIQREEEEKVPQACVLH